MRRRAAAELWMGGRGRGENRWCCSVVHLRGAKWSVSARTTFRRSKPTHKRGDRGRAPVTTMVLMQHPSPVGGLPSSAPAIVGISEPVSSANERSSERGRTQTFLQSRYCRKEGQSRDLCTTSLPTGGAHSLKELRARERLGRSAEQPPPAHDKSGELEVHHDLHPHISTCCTSCDRGTSWIPVGEGKQGQLCESCDCSTGTLPATIAPM